MKIFRKICVAMLLGVMTTQAIGADINNDLADAIYIGDLAKVKQLVKFGANAKGRDNVGTPFLYTAISRYSQETAESKKDARWEIVKYLIDNGADVNVSSGIVLYEVPVFMYAVGSLSLEKIKYLISKGGKVNNDGDGRSAFDYAIARGDIDILQYVLSQGAKVTNESIYRLYEKIGVSAFKKDNKLKDKMTQMVKNLIKANKEHINECSGSISDLLLSKTVRNQDIDMAQFLLDNGADINIQCGSRGSTILMNSIGQYKEDLDRVKWLVSKGADVNIKNSEGKTVLTQALESGYYDIAEFLMENGAKKE